MNGEDDSDKQRRARSDTPGDFQRSVERLERAVQKLVSAANDQVSTRASGFIDDAAERLERELRGRRDARNSSGIEEPRYESRRSRRRRRRHEPRERLGGSGTPGYRTSRLYCDRHHRKVSGVCAGLARYFGVEVWVVRGMAITGLIFMPSVVIPAYIIAAIVLPKAPNGETVDVERTATDYSSPAPELGARLSPRGSLRSVQAAFDQIELKLRRIESHVTSGQFELQRELKRIDA